MVSAPRAAVVCSLLALAGCSLITDSFLTNDFSGDPFPVNVDTSTGAVIVGMRPTGQDWRPAVIDLLSPITIADPCPDNNMTCTAVEREPTLTVTDVELGEAGATGELPRARFPNANLIGLHPCPYPDPPAGVDPLMVPVNSCPVGDQTSKPFTGVFGADALAGDAVRLRLGDNQIFILPDIGGSDRGRSLSCDAVFDAPYRGGGTLVIAGTELPFSNLRIAVQACLGPDADPNPDPPQTSVNGTAMAQLDPAAFRQHGADALFVVSTGVGISILGEAAYQRYQFAQPAGTVPDLSTLPTGSATLPSGPVQGHLASISSLALVASPSTNSLSPCRQLYAHRIQLAYQLTDQLCRLDAQGHSIIDCPCKDSSTFCPVPAILELTPGTIDVLVVPDTDPTLQALRAELRPDQPEVDGILGTNVLRTAEIDVDYPHDRLVARCPGPGCHALPQLLQSEDLCQVKNCVAGINHGDGTQGPDALTRPNAGCPGAAPLPVPCLKNTCPVTVPMPPTTPTRPGSPRSPAR